MNMPINICLKCGNPRNIGERICRFCGEAFPDAPSSPLAENNEVEVINDDMTKVNRVNVNNENDSSQDNTMFHSGETTVPQDEIAVNDEMQTELPTSNNLVVDSVNAAEVDESDNPVQSTNKEEEKERIPICPYGLDKKNDGKKYYRISKKALWIWLSVLLLVGLCVGGFFIYKHLKGDSPSDVVTRAFDCLKEKDYDGFCSYMDLSNKSKALMNDLCPKVMKWYGDDIDHIEAKSEKINEDDTAEVGVTLYFKDGKNKDVDISLVKIKDKWKIKPFGDFDVGMDSLLGIGSLFGFDTENSLTENILNIFGKFF